MGVPVTGAENEIVGVVDESAPPVKPGWPSTTMLVTGDTRGTTVWASKVAWGA